MNKQGVEVLKETIKRYAKVTSVVLDPTNENQVWKFGIITKDGEENLNVTLTDEGNIYHLKGSFHLDFLNLLQSILKDIKRNKR